VSGLKDPEHPLAVDGVEVVPTADGYVVYDEQSDRVHYLNHTAALVLEFCTGENSAEEIIGMLQLAYDLPEPPEAETRECLTRLRAEGLVQ
jgi:PqqD family protein of HPr-rel-A system